MGVFRVRDSWVEIRAFLPSRTTAAADRGPGNSSSSGGKQVTKAQQSEITEALRVTLKQKL